MMAELAELGFESFVETDEGLEAYIQEAIFNEGHYSTFLKEDGENGQWKRYNDNQIDDLDTLSKEDMDAISRDCYLILYKEIIQS